MATHSSILAWRIPWTEELGGLQSMGHKESGTTEQLNKNKTQLTRTWANSMISYNIELCSSMWSDPDPLGKLKTTAIANAKKLPEVGQLHTPPSPLPLLSASSNPSSTLSAKLRVPICKI